jgi:hypothetical protein
MCKIPANKAQVQKGYGEMPEKLRPASDMPVASMKSMGSVDHPHNCKECFFLMFHVGGCKAGKNCQYCHEFHPRANPRKNRQHMAKWNLMADCDTASNQAPPLPVAPQNELLQPITSSPGNMKPQSGAIYPSSSLDIQSRMLKYSNIYQQNAQHIQRFMQEFGINGMPDTDPKESITAIDATPTMVAPRGLVMEAVQEHKDMSSDGCFSPRGAFDHDSFSVSTDAGCSRQVSANTEITCSALGDASRQVSLTTEDSYYSACGETAITDDIPIMEEASLEPQSFCDSISLRYAEAAQTEEHGSTALILIAGAHAHIPAQVEATNEKQETPKEHFSFTVKPPLPEGLSLCNRTGVITGRPLRAQETTEHDVTISIAAKCASGGMVALTHCPITLRVLDLLDYNVSPISSKDEECSQIVLTLNKR